MIGAILLAAGRSRRMGTQKLLLPWANGTVIRHIADEILASPVGDVVVVIAEERAADSTPPGGIADALRGLNVRLAINRDPGADMLSSVRCGLRALPPDGEAALVALGDQPTLGRQLIGDLITAWRKAPGSIVVPAFEGRRGHPVLFPMHHRNQILHEFEGIGLRGLLAAHPGKIIEVPAPSADALADIDHPDDYQRLRP